MDFERNIETLKRKGQAGAIVGLLFAVVLIAALSIMFDPLLQFINIGVNATVNSTHGSTLGVLFNMYPVFIALTVLVAVVVLITGRR